MPSADPISMNRPASAGEAASFTLGDVLAIIGRQRTLALIAALLAASGMIANTALKTPLFEAQATVALDRGRRPVDFDPRSQFDPYTGNYEHDLLNTQRTVLLSRSVLQASLKSSGLLTNEGYVANADALERLRSRLSIATSRDSWDLTISLRDEDARHAEAGLQAVIDAYLARQIGHEKERAERSISFLEEQVTEAQRKVERAREQMQQFQREKDLFVLDPEKSFPAQRLTSLNSKKVVLTQQIGALSTLVEQIGNIDTAFDPLQRQEAMLGLELVNRHPVVVDQQRLLFQLRTEEANLSQKYLDRHPRMIELRAAIATKQEQLTQAIGSVRAGVLTDFEKMNAQLPTVEQSIREVQGELNTYRENLFQLQTLTQQARTAEQLYEQLLRRLGEERVTQRIDAQQLTIVDPPNSTGRAVNLNWTLAIMLALVMGGAAAVGVPLMVEFLGRRTYGQSNIRNLLGMPVLGEIPFIPDLKPLGASADPDRPRPMAEAFRNLRTALRLERRGEGELGECLVVASCGEHDGKSTVATRLAVSMASSGLKVLLVDADLRRPSLHVQLGQMCDRGLGQLLAGEPDMVPATTTYTNLDLMDAGTPPANPAELLNSHCLPEWLQHCRQRYDYIIIDTPPLDLFSDTLLVGVHADSLLLVVRDGLTPKASLQAARERLQILAPRRIDVVMVGREEAMATLAYYGHRLRSTG